MGGYTLLIVATFVGFALLAALLLTPVYRFLEREEQASEAWTPDRIAERLRQRRTSANGTADHDQPQHTLEDV